jgi:hypothetical protein
MASVQVLPLNNYANGSRQLGPIDLASDVTSVLFNIQRCTTATPTIWPNVTTTLEIIPEVSLDGGSTWIEAGRTTNVGGIQLSKFGTELAFCLSGGGLPAEVGGVTRQYRVQTTIAGGPLRTSATVEVN